MYGLKNFVALIGGLFLLSQSVTGAAVPTVPYPTYGTLTCTDVSATGLPLKKDCKAALDQVPPGKPEVCTDVFLTEFDYITVETCTIHTYSVRGSAHCLDRDLIIKGGNEILDRCTPYKGYIGGQYEWSTDGKKEGFKFVKAPIK